MNGISQRFPKSNQLILSDPFSERSFHLIKICAEEAARISKKPNLRGANFLDFPVFSSSLFWMNGISQWFSNSHQRTFPDRFQYRNFYLIKKCSGKMPRTSRRPRLRGASFLEFWQFFQAVCFKWTVYPSFFQKQSKNNVWSLLRGKYSFEQNLRWRSG